jgi:hypothetical protein
MVRKIKENKKEKNYTKFHELNSPKNENMSQIADDPALIAA